MSFKTVNLSAGLTNYEYNTEPQGDLVVFLHGGTMPSWCYDAQVPELNQNGFKTLRYDMYGRGGSDAPDAAYDRAFYLRQLEDLLTALNITEPFYLVGTSFGGATASNYTFHHPDRVKKLILVSPAIDWISHQPMARLLRIPVLGRIIFEKIGKKRTLKRAIGFLSELKGTLAKQYTDLFLAQTKLESFWRTLFLMLTSDAFNDYRPVLKALSESGFDRVELLWGDGDDEIKEPEIRDLLQLFPGTKLVEAHGSGHGLMAESPEKITAFVLQALRN